MRVPLIISGKNIPKNIVEEELVCLRDITSTILSLSGNDVPFYMDSIPLPTTPGDNKKRRKEIFGFLANGVMVFDGRYKLVRYSTGEDLLFDLKNDPSEEKNIIEDENNMDILDYLDDCFHYYQGTFPWGEYYFGYKSGKQYFKICNLYDYHFVTSL